MNTINYGTTKPYSNYTLCQQRKFSNNTEAYKVNFKGKIGSTIVQEIMITNKVPTADSIISEIKGTFGLSIDKTKDSFTALLNLVQKLLNENLAEMSMQNKLKGDIQELKNKLLQTEKELSMERAEKSDLLSLIGKKHNENLVLEEKVQQLEAQQAKIKPLSTTGVLMPVEVKGVLEEYRGINDSAHKSMLTYLITGRNEASAVKQAEMADTLKNARENGLFELPELNAKFEELCGDGIRPAADATYNHLKLIENTLKLSDEGNYILVPKFREQIQANAEALIEPSKKANIHYPEVSNILDNVIKFHKNIESSKQELAKQGWKCTDKTIVDYNPLKSYYSFKNEKDNTLWELSAADLANRNFGLGRRTDANNNVTGKICIWKL